MNLSRSQIIRSMRSPKSFTLVELIISMMIFVIFIGVVSSTFFFVSRGLRQATEVRDVYAEARFLMDKITQDVRLLTVDYACLEDSSDPTEQYGSDYLECEISGLSDANSGLSSNLPLISADGLYRIIYHFDESVDEPMFSVLKLSWDEDQGADGAWVPEEGYYEGFQPFEMSSVVLDSVEFMIKPLSSPYENITDAAAQYQPSVHVLIKARSTSTVLDEVVQVTMQSVISSRVYGVSF